MNGGCIASILRLVADTVRPEKRMPLFDWAPAHFHIPRKNNPRGGPFRLRNNPVMEGPLRAYDVRRYTRRVYLCAAQTWKSTMIGIECAYEISHRPGRGLIVYPDQNTGKRRSQLFWSPHIEENPCLREERTGNADDEQTFQYNFRRCSWTLGWAGSAASLAADPIRYLKRDEIGKFKRRDKNEADPMSLSEERIKAFGDMARITDATTPSTESMPGWAEYVGSTQHRCFLPCPHCSKPSKVKNIPALVVDCADVEKLERRLRKAGFFIPKFHHFKFESSDSLEAIEADAYIECPLCEATIEEKHRKKMLAGHRWVPLFPDRNTVGFQNPEWLVPWGTIGGVARKFIAATRAQDKSAKLQNFNNSVKAEVHIEKKVEAIDTDFILSHVPSFLDSGGGGYPRDTLPFVPSRIFLCVDIQGLEMYYTIRAHRRDQTSAMLRYGNLPRLNSIANRPGSTLRALDDIRKLIFPGPDGSFGIDQTLIDSGYDSTEVYDYTRGLSNVWPVKGNTGIGQLWLPTKPEKNPNKTPRRDSVTLLSLQVDRFQDTLQNRFTTQLDDPGAWWIHEGTSEEDYASHFVHDSKEERIVGGVSVHKWTHPKGCDNHYRDTEVYQVAASQIFDVTAGEAAPAVAVSEVKPSEFITKGYPKERKSRGGNYLTTGKS